MRAIVYLVLVGVVVASIFWLAQRRVVRSTRVEPRSLPNSSSATSANLDERAAPARLLFGPDSGTGWLRLSATQLVFTADAGRVLALERFEINGVGASNELPDRRVARPALVVSTSDAVHYFDLPDPEAWVRALSR